LRQTVGQAYIDGHRCIAWAGVKPCIVCEEMCLVNGEAAIRVYVPPDIL